MDPEIQKIVEFGLSYDQNRLLPFVAFFQASGSGQGCAYTLQARSEGDAQKIVGEYAQEEWGEDAGEVMVYSPAQLRNLADRLDALQRGELGPEDEGWDIG